LTSGHSDAQSWASECPDVKNYKWRLNPVWHRMLYSCTHMANSRLWRVNLSTSIGHFRSRYSTWGNDSAERPNLSHSHINKPTSKPRWYWRFNKDSSTWV